MVCRGYDVKTMQLVTLHGPHGRRVRVGQVWQSNDPRKWAKRIRVTGLRERSCLVDVVHLDTGNATAIAAKNFTVGQRGWSLLQEAR